MQSWLIAKATSVVIAVIAAAIVAWYVAHRATVVTDLTDLDHWIERKTGLNVPDAIPQAIVAWLDATAGDKRSTRQTIRQIMTLTDPNKTKTLLDELQRRVMELGESWAIELDGATPELKTMVNEGKQILGSRVLTARQPEKKAEQIQVAITIAGSAALADHKSEPITVSDMKRMIVESQERQDRLLAKGEGK